MVSTHQLPFRGSERSEESPEPSNHRPGLLGSGLSSLRSEPRNDWRMEPSVRTTTLAISAIIIVGGIGVATADAAPTVRTNGDGTSTRRETLGATSWALG